MKAILNAGIPASNYAHKSVTVVYIEDDHASAMLVQCLLGMRVNYTFHHAVNGADGLELCRRLQPDLVLIDLHLPDMTGCEIFKRLRADPATCDLSCVVVSADAMPGTISRARDAGFAKYLTKPIDVRRFLHQLDELLEMEALACC
ncbi:response regulator [Azohydromonas australica]|uniref:response regulator n=1 Tax=Azohydromonas australica TaxID=364039 RepID=UPI0009FE4354|nr:response regulator [Azohydromonas australica]